MKALIISWTMFLAVTPFADVFGYKTGKTYPEFCSTINQQALRGVPKIKRDSPLFNAGVNVKLQHVTAIIRDGARAPSAKHECWDIHRNWDCAFSAMTAPPSKLALDFLVGQELIFGEKVITPAEQDTVTYKSASTPSFLFEKRYDANISPSGSNHFPPNMGNHLGGTCQAGQLTVRGYEQQKQNGNFLLHAYVKDSLNDVGMDKAMDEILWNFDEEMKITTEGQRAYDDPNIYFRSDDDQSTLMSGMLVIRQLFEELMQEHMKIQGLTDRYNPVVRVHTSDRDRDVFAPNYDTCPALLKIELEAQEAESFYTNYTKSHEAKLMMSLADEFLGGWYKVVNPEVAMDCIMTSTCSDRETPYVLDPELSHDDSNLKMRYGDDIFNRFVKFHTERKSYIYRHQNAIFSKLVTNPIWNDILSGLLAFADADINEMKKAWPDLRPPLKMSLYSGHDSTLMALLSSLGPTVWNGSDWPPYGSMILIELYELDFSNSVQPQGSTSMLKSTYRNKIAFRMIYNGEVLTNRIAGCPANEELCDIDILVLHVFQFSNVTEWEEMCDAPEKKKSGGDEEDKGGGFGTLDPFKDRKGDTRTKNINGFQLFISGLVCAGFGALAMYAFMIKSQGTTNEELQSLELTATVMATSPTHNSEAERSSLYGMRHSPTAAII